MNAHQMTADALAQHVNSGNAVRVLFTDARGKKWNPIVNRASVQRFGSLDLVTFHAPHAPDHVGEYSTKGSEIVNYATV